MDDDKLGKIVCNKQMTSDVELFIFRIIEWMVTRASNTECLLYNHIICE